MPLIPAAEVRRAFGLIIQEAPIEMAAFLRYIANTYVGLTHAELAIEAVGGNAFDPTTTFLDHGLNRIIKLI